MILFKLYEKRNNESEWCKDVYITEAAANENAKQIGKSYHAESVDGKYKMIPDVYEYRTERFEQSNVGFDVYHHGTPGSKGKRFSYDSYEDAVKSYQHFVQLREYVALQLPLKQFGMIGVTKVMDNLDQKYWNDYDAYWEAKESEETWRPGDAPWDAPGMCVADFF